MLEKCPECKNPVSSRAKTCVHCGFARGEKLPPRLAITGVFDLVRTVFGLVMLLLGVGLLFGFHGDHISEFGNVPGRQVLLIVAAIGLTIPLTILVHRIRSAVGGRKQKNRTQRRQK